MTLVTRILMILMLVAPMGELFAQETETTTAQATTTATNTAEAAPAEAKTVAAEERPSAEFIREQFILTVRRHPARLGRVLALEPTLLLNPAFVAGYPELEHFLNENPEIRRNPHYYVRQFEESPVVYRDSAVEEIFDGLAIMGTVGLVAFALAWLLRTIIEQRRWNRLTRTQTEVHNKILDRFGNNQELLEYIKTPAGSKFLESAPIPLHAEAPAATQTSSPMSRILWSIQLGVVVVAGALGTLLVSFRFDGEDAQALFALGGIAFCVGAGFIVSAVVSLNMSQKLGLWQGSSSTPSASNEPGLMR